MIAPAASPAAFACSAAPQRAKRLDFAVLLHQLVAYVAGRQARTLPPQEVHLVGQAEPGGALQAGFTSTDYAIGERGVVRHDPCEPGR